MHLIESDRYVSMKIGVVNEETWAFFNEIYQEFSDYHQTQAFTRRHSETPLFQSRFDRRLLKYDLQAFLHNNQVVFFEWASELLAAATHLPKSCGIVTRLHRYELYQWADQVNWEVVDKIILVSDAKKVEFSQRFPEQCRKIVVIPEAISLDRFNPIPRDFSGDIGILCHLSPRKRVYELILAFYELSRVREGIRLHIGGDPHPRFPDYAPALHNLVSELGLTDRVIFYGKVTDPLSWYAKVDIFISNSYSEGLQVSPMEAIATGCYCLSHRWDGANELLPEQNLYYSDQELMQKISAYCDASEAERQEKVAALMGVVRDQFDVEKTKVQIREVVESVGNSYHK
jgi:glycosyltransferase involved in cell wall biosynthesis